MGPWNHVGVTMEKNWTRELELDHCSDPSGTESNNMQLNKTFRGGVLGLAPCHVDRKIKLQARLHSNLDGSSLAHAIQVPMGPLQE